MKKFILTIAVGFASAAAWAASAAFAYQGVLQNEDGSAMTGNKVVEFRLYSQGEGGSVLWGRACSVLLDATGLFNTELSDVSGSKLSDAPDATLPAVFAANAEKTLYIGMTVTGSSGEISPRQKLLAVPYATFASDVSSASGDFSVSGVLTARSADIAGTVFASRIETKGDVSVGGNLAVSGAISGFGTVPTGGIIMWNGAEEEIPDGWALCNGENGTPDLRNRFVVGAGSGGGYAVGDTGGANSVTLTVAQMPSHSHVISAKTVGYAGGWNARQEALTYDGNAQFNGRRDVAGDATGGGQAHENRPPYYALCFIMRVK